MASHLADHSSAYLRSAAHQPVDWYPWSPEAFVRARQENKPILLDIGAVWCHWCHVMDGESYENPRVAEALNREWICIKVDRDERPDVDARYQRAVQVFSGQGGWPLTAFLTPDGEVFYGGTYFPPDGKHGRPGFLTVLAELSRIYRDEPVRVSSQAEQIRHHLEGLAQEASPGTVGQDALDQAADAMARAFDFRNGGFGTQPKFPHPGACDFLLARGYAASQDADVGLDDDGDYFTWTPEEARAAVTEDEFAVLARHYDIDDPGEMHHNPKKNVLWIRQSASEISAGTGRPVDRVAALLESGRRTLRETRGQRKAPSVDTTVYTGWSAMMASALLESAAALGRADVDHHALVTLERLFTEGVEQDGAGGVRHALGGADTRVLEDQVQLACSALDAFEVTGDRYWLTRALAPARYTWAEFASDDGGLYDIPRHRR